jgi:DNA topoisomerase-1
MLEKSGIGRPSTYASIITKLYEKQYIIKSKDTGIQKEYVNYNLNCTRNKKQIVQEIKEHKYIGVDDNKIKPHEIGFTVNTFVSNSFPQIVNSKFTSDMEASLDKIEKGEIDYKIFLTKFYNDDFEKTYNNIYQMLTPTDKSDLGKTEIVISNPKIYAYLNNECSQCILRTARYGPVIELRYTNSTSKYLSLKAYLDDSGKTMNELNTNEIITLLSTPFLVQHEGKLYDVCYGRYGFYIIFEKKNYRVYKKLIALVISQKYVELFTILKIL